MWVELRALTHKKGDKKIEIKNWSRPVPKPEVVKAKRRGVKKFISKKGFTEPALKYDQAKRMKLYRGKKRLI